MLYDLCCTPLRSAYSTAAKAAQKVLMKLTPCIGEKNVATTINDALSFD